MEENGGMINPYSDLSEAHVKNIRIAIEADGSSWHIAKQLEKQEYTEQCTKNRTTIWRMHMLTELMKLRSDRD